MNNLKLGFSSCPNDTFIFEALVNNRLGSSLQVDTVIMDVEALNRQAAVANLEVSKMSFAAYPAVSANYQILSSGSALGRGCGPLIISKEPLDLSNLNSMTIAVPGKNTTANLLLSIFFPEVTMKSEILFSEIEDKVLNDEFPLGLIIHESRFTYAAKGLHLVADLGDLWEQRFGLPIPLGCIAVKRSLPEAEKMEIQNLIRQSVEWAFLHPEDSAGYVGKYALEMSREVQKMHIGLYVNNFSLDLGEEGRKAIRMLFNLGHGSGFFPEAMDPIFINNVI